VASEDHIQDSIILKQEAYLYTRYLLECEPIEEIVQRYIIANQKLGTDKVCLGDDNILKFSRSHPCSIPFLDAAAGLIQPELLLRKKIYIMAALLEASTRYADYFLPRSLSVLSLSAQITVSVISSGLKMLIGIPLLFIIRRRVT